MTRTFVGGLVAGVVLFLAGFLFWGTPLADIAYARTDDTHGAAVQTALAQNLTQSGTGAYLIPDMHTAQGTTLYGQGPVALIQYNTSGFPVMDMNMLVTGFIVALVAGVLMAFALAAVGGGGRSFANMARLIVLYSLSFTLWSILAMPVFNHFGWTYWVYSFVSESVALIAAGLAVARWFLPRVYVADAL